MKLDLLTKSKTLPSLVGRIPAEDARVPDGDAEVVEIRGGGGGPGDGVRAGAGERGGRAPAGWIERRRRS